MSTGGSNLRWLPAYSTTVHGGFAEQANWCAVSWECCQLLKTLVSEHLLSCAHSANLQYEQKKSSIVTVRQAAHHEVLI